MAMNWTKYARKKINDHVWSQIEYVFPTTGYLALFSADPTDEGTLTDELSEGGYARVEISSLMGETSLSTGVISNSAEITFGPATEDWPEITHIALMDSATIGAGNMLAFMPAVTSRTVVADDDFKIRVGQLTFEQK